jgi:hypothetical protein
MVLLQLCNAFHLYIRKKCQKYHFTADCVLYFRPNFGMTNQYPTQRCLSLRPPSTHAFSYENQFLTSPSLHASAARPPPQIQWQSQWKSHLLRRTACSPPPPAAFTSIKTHLAIAITPASENAACYSAPAPRRAPSLLLLRAAPVVHIWPHRSAAEHQRHRRRFRQL